MAEAQGNEATPGQPAPLEPGSSPVERLTATATDAVNTLTDVLKQDPPGLEHDEARSSARAVLNAWVETVDRYENELHAFARRNREIAASLAAQSSLGQAYSGMTCAMMCGNVCASVCSMCGSVCSMCGNASVCSMCGNASVCSMCGNVGAVCASVCTTMCGCGCCGCCCEKKKSRSDGDDD